MINTIDIQRIFRDVWGFSAPPFPEIVAGMLVRDKKASYHANEFELEVHEKMEQSQMGVSYYGINTLRNEVFMPVWISEADNFLEYLLPNTTMSLTSRKNIVITPLVNRDGTVKEEISIDDWEIRIKGVMIGKYNQYPEEEKQRLVEWYMKKRSLYVQNVRTAICLTGKEQVIMTELAFPELRGFENVQPYELKMISDTAFSLIVE